MAVKDILVHVDDGERSKARVDVAAAIAGRTGARLIGFGVNPAVSIPAFVGAEIPAQIWEAQAAEMEKRLAAAGKTFQTQASRAGLTADWRVLADRAGDLAGIVSLHARYADLTVLGQPDPERDGRGLTRDALERVVLDAGGPVLVIPYVGDVRSVGKRAMLAWNGSREAARAARDAMRVLEPGAHITIMQVNPKGRDHAQRDMPGVDIASHLARHGYKCEAAHIIAEDMKVGDMILSRAADMAADTIVMGAYGHSRLRELVLGGATAHVLTHMTVPVLMSH